MFLEVYPSRRVSERARLTSLAIATLATRPARAEGNRRASYELPCVATRLGSSWWHARCRVADARAKIQIRADEGDPVTEWGRSARRERQTIRNVGATARPCVEAVRLGPWRST